MRASSETSDESDDDDAWCASCERCGEVCFGASETLASLALAKHRDGACGARVRGDGDGATRETTPKREYHRKCTLCENFEVNEDDKKQFFAAWGRHANSEEHLLNAERRRRTKLEKREPGGRARATVGESALEFPTRTCETCAVTIRGSGEANLANNWLQHARTRRHQELAHAAKETAKAAKFASVVEQKAPPPVRVRNVYDALESAGSERSGSPAPVFDDSAEISPKHGTDSSPIALDKSAGAASVLAYMCDRSVGRAWRDARPTLVSHDRVDETARDMAVLGTLFDVPKHFAQNEFVDKREMFMDVGIPFCGLVYGAPGASTSHTVDVLVENCLMRQGMVDPPQDWTTAITFSTSTTDAFSKDASLANFLGLSVLSLHLETLCGKNSNCRAPHVKVLSAPKHIESRAPEICDEYDRNGFVGMVSPLLFGWNSLTSEHLCIMLGIEDDEQILKMIRHRTSFKQFFEGLCDSFRAQRDGSRGQLLLARAQQVKSFIYENYENVHVEGVVMRVFEQAVLVDALNVVDVTHSEYEPDFVDAIFQVALSMFQKMDLPLKRTARNRRSPPKKLIVIDDADLLLSLGSRAGFAGQLVNAARTMHRTNTRLVVGTTSPFAIPEALVELATVHVLHQFNSARWFDHIARNAALQEANLSDVRNLQPGESLVCANMLCCNWSAPRARAVKMRIRNRLTRESVRVVRTPLEEATHRFMRDIDDSR